MRREGWHLIIRHIISNCLRYTGQFLGVYDTHRLKSRVSRWGGGQICYWRGRSCSSLELVLRRSEEMTWMKWGLVCRGFLVVRCNEEIRLLVHHWNFMDLVGLSRTLEFDRSRWTFVDLIGLIENSWIWSCWKFMDLISPKIH